jgi:hypothetical protein
VLVGPGCLLGAIQAVAKNLGKSDMAKDAVVHTSVHIGPAAEMKGFGLAVDIKVEGIDEELLKAGHEVRYLYALADFFQISISIVVLPVQSCLDQRSCRERVNCLILDAIRYLQIIKQSEK